MKPPYYKIPDPGDPSDVLQLFPQYNLSLLCCRYWWLKKWEFKKIESPYWRIYYNKLKGARIVFDNITYELNPDKILVVAPNTSFKSELTGEILENKEYDLKGGRVDQYTSEQKVSDFGGVLHLFIHFNLGMPFDNIKPGVFVFEMTEHLNQKIKIILNHLSVDFARFSFYSALAIQSLIGDLLSDIKESRWDLRSNDYRILKVLDYIEKNIKKPLNNENLAEKVNMATNAFIRLFTTETGVSPQRYVKKMRIDNACVLLHHSNNSIETIALETGFADRFHFSRVFKKITGISPAKYRKEFEITH
ncbi:MAG: AraC family transcriptional regulator [Prolixibacteraceae bacterium]|nr:AraC family transcriptional regulator [Prolixibacteraceae bacterium]